MIDPPFGATSFSAVRSFRDVEVVPFTELLLSADREHRGGPIWPDWPDDDHLGYWHSSSYSRADRPPERPESTDTVGGANFFWVGAFYPHFGHQIRDLSSRIIGSLSADPQAVLVYATSARGARIPGWFWDINAWFGATRERVVVVQRPTRFSTLSIVPQPEWAGTNVRNVEPDPEYLEALRLHADRTVGRIERRGTLLVSRARMLPDHNLLGEAEIDRYFQRNGHRVLHPERIPLSEQLRAYMGAEHLVFSAGSALHGLQLLGRNVGDVTVIRRSPDASDYGALLQSRCESHREVDCVLAVTTIGGRVSTAGAKALLDSRQLVRRLDVTPADRHAPVRFRHVRFLVRAAGDLAGFIAASVARKVWRRRRGSTRGCAGSGSGPVTQSA